MQALDRRIETGRLKTRGGAERALGRVLATHCYATVEMPLTDGSVKKIRKPGRPEACQWDIYRKLGIDTMSNLPKTENSIPTTKNERNL